MRDGDVTVYRLLVTNRCVLRSRCGGGGSRVSFLDRKFDTRRQPPTVRVFSVRSPPRTLCLFARLVAAAPSSSRRNRVYGSFPDRTTCNGKHDRDLLEIETTNGRTFSRLPPPTTISVQGTQSHGVSPNACFSPRWSLTFYDDRSSKSRTDFRVHIRCN